MSKVTLPSKQLIHELNSAAQHRIIILNADGSSSESPWTPVADLIEHEGYFACASPAYPLPSGIFRVTATLHRVLA